MEPQIGNYLKEARLKAGMTQEQLSNKTNLSIASISAYENNNGKPNIDSFARIAKTLNVSMDKLYFGAKNGDQADAEVFSAQEAALSFANLFLNNYISDVKYSLEDVGFGSKVYEGFVLLRSDSDSVADLLEMLKNYKNKSKFMSQPSVFLREAIDSCAKEIDARAEECPF